MCSKNFSMQSLNIIMGNMSGVFLSMMMAGWCKYKNNPVLIEEARVSNGFRDKMVHAQQYKKVMQIYEHFCTDTMLQQLYHHWSLQKNKSLNQQVMQVMLKDT